MAGIPIHSASPISPHAPMNSVGIIRSTSAASLRYTPATASANRSATASPSPLAPPPRAGALTTPSSSPTIPPRATDTPSPASLLGQTSDPPALNPTSSPSNLPPRLKKLSIPASTNGSSPNTAPPRSFHAVYPPTYETPYQPTNDTYSLSALSPYNHTPPTPLSRSTNHDLSHPPGYQQSGSSFSELASPYSPSNQRAYHTNAKSGLSILDGEYHTEARPDEDETPLSALGKGMWETAVKWTKIAGEKFKEGEQEVWKRMNDREG